MENTIFASRFRLLKRVKNNTSEEDIKWEEEWHFMQGFWGGPHGEGDL